VGAITVTVADPLAPGESDNPEVVHTPLHPEGGVSLRLNVDGAQEVPSLSLIVAVKFTGVPAVT
jgi:hypothetical protein